MAFPWFLKPDILLHAELLHQQEELSQAHSNSYLRDRDQNRQIAQLQAQVRDLQLQLLALEAHLAQQGLLPPQPAEKTQNTAPGEIPANEIIACPHCGRRQKRSIAACFDCGAPLTTPKP